MKFEMNITDRKVLIRRAQALTGEMGDYTRLPRCAYVFHGFSIEKDGTVIANEEADQNILQTMLDEGLIKGEITENTPFERPIENAEENSAETEIGDSQIVETSIEDSEISEETEEAEKEKPAAATETPQASEKPEEPAEEPEELAPEDIGEETEFIKPNIGFPLESHSGRSLKNLVFLLYSRGHLISKSTGGDFGAEDAVTDALKIAPEYPNARGVVEQLKKYEAEHGKGMRGIEFTDEQVVFSGFPATDDQDEIQAFVHLASLMNRQAIEQNRIQTRPVDESNEKYSMRTWLLRIGMNGDEFKETRSLLMKNLDGHTAFRTPADAERWKARRKAIRDEQKAAAEADVATDTTPDTATDADSSERTVD